ncbi:MULTISPECIES: hypothetical protein [Streptomyces]|uniref:Integral membrane protein n=1 Tax=Streptomyces canarius TaxID=285453 RepID=A0ABQ3CXI5_9ACTN|nr:hypothetical protein [Streptomyces canarius]GHA48702.1 hypothetical protein GCM10010345_61460 [Streptomyces canarius]
MVQFLAMAPAGADGGLWPVVGSRVASVMVIAVVLALYRSPATPPGRLAAVAGVGGAVGTVAILLHPAATRHQLMAVATVLSALCPAIPVLPALAFPHERLTRRQTAGLVCATAAIAHRPAPTTVPSGPVVADRPGDPSSVVPRDPVGPLSRPLGALGAVGVSRVIGACLASDSGGEADRKPSGGDPHGRGPHFDLDRMARW